MISIINKYELNYMKVYIYGDLGKAFSLKDDINSAYKYLLMANEFAKTCDVESEYYGMLIIALTHCYNRLGKYEDGIRECESISNKIPHNLKKRITYNKILMLKRIGRYNDALEEIRGFEDVFIDRKKETTCYEHDINIEMIKGNCYREQGYLNKSLKLFKELHKSLNKTKEMFDKRILCLGNIIEVSSLLENDYYEYRDMIIQEIENNKDEFEKNYLASEVYKLLADIYANNKQENSLKVAYGYTLKSLEIAERYKNMDMIDYNINKLIEYIPNVEECTIEVVQKYILSLVQSRMIKLDSKVILRLINFHMVNNNKKEAKNIIDFCKRQAS